jgi:hypothetical protein
MPLHRGHSERGAIGERRKTTVGESGAVAPLRGRGSGRLSGEPEVGAFDHTDKAGRVTAQPPWSSELARVQGVAFSM